MLASDCQVKKFGSFIIVHLTIYHTNIYQCSEMKNFDPRELLQKYNDQVHYNFWISLALSQEHHEVVFEFLEKVPNFAEKGK